MAYDPNKRKNSQPTAGEPNPYESMTGPTATAKALPPPGIAAPAAPEQPYGGALATGEGVDSGPSATGYVNFDRIYGANEGVAAREAQKRGDAAKGAAQNAQAGLTGIQGKFNSGVTGATNSGPSAADYTYATGQAQFAQPKTQQMANRDKSAATVAQQPGGFAVKNPTESEWRSNLEAGANKGYTGPDALSGMDEYLKLAQDTEAAQQAINNPTTGLNQMDAALLGAAGRPRYAELQQQYGNLKGDLDAANTASAAQGKAAADASKTGENEYSRLLSDYDTEKAREAAYAAAHQTPPAPSVGPGGVATLGQAADSTAGQDFSHVGTQEYEDQAKTDLNPATYGARSDDANYNMGLYKTFSGTSNDDAIQRSQGATWNEKFHNWVESQVGPVTPAEWSDLESMTPEQQKAWFDDKKSKKASGG